MSAAEVELEEFEGVTCIAETRRAILVRLADDSRHWVPKSTIHADSEVFESGHEGRLVIPTWLAEKNGMEP